MKMSRISRALVEAGSLRLDLEARLTGPGEEPLMAKSQESFVNAYLGRGGPGQRGSRRLGSPVTMATT
jgi:hypothetical protein